MRELRRTAIVPRAASVLYALVNDIELYPQFVPGCTFAQVLERTPLEIVARLGVRRGGLQSEFTTRNRLLPDEAVQMRLVNGPFKSFEGDWSFKPLGTAACEIGLVLRYQFSNPLKRALLEPLFAGTADQLVTAFVQRAQQC